MRPAFSFFSFTEDRLSRRRFRRFIDMPRDRLIVAQQGSELAGYCLVLMSAATRLARIYSIAVSAEAAVIVRPKRA